MYETLIHQKRCAPVEPDVEKPYSVTLFFTAKA